MLARPAWGIVLGALLVAGAIPAGAAPMAGAQLRATSLELSSAQTISIAHLLQANHRPDEPADTQTMSLQISAASGTVEVFHDEEWHPMADGYGVKVTAPQQAYPLANSQSPVATYGPGAMVMTSKGTDAYYVVDGFSTAGVALSSAGTTASVSTVQGVQVEESGIQQTGTGGTTSNDPSGNWWTHYRIDSPQLVSVVSPQNATVNATGDLVLEVVGVDFTLQDGTGEHSIHSGRSATAMATAPTGDGLYDETTDFVRITLSHAVVSFAMHSPGGSLAWASDSVGASALSGAVADHAGGTVTGTDGKQVSVASARVAIPGASRLDVVPRGDGLMDVAVVGPSPDARSMVAVPLAWASAAAALVVSTAGVLFAVTLGTWRRHRRPSQEQVERAMVEGSYGRAARLASRILDESPGQEDAVISRAIALAKQGHQQSVIDELTAHLEGRDPTDGVLHYVLGLAYLDLGQQAEAREALSEAVRRTPSLGQEAAQRMGIPSPRDLGDVHGYA
ncbi:MAG: tetratricopeptide repeat protein [Thermoplasmatota archaeon]